LPSLSKCPWYARSWRYRHIQLLPNRIDLIGGLFYGLNFGLGGIAAALLGVLADSYGIQTVYQICSFLPLAGLMIWFLPRIEEGIGT